MGNSDIMQDVEAIDGMLMITQYDIPWNEDLKHWHFYDISQSVTFRKNGYRIVVPSQEESWVLHDAGYCNMEHYDKVRKEFCKLYKNDGFEYRGVDDYIYTNRMKECLAMKQNFKSTIESADIEKIERYAKMLEERYSLDTELGILKILLEIRESELKCGRASTILMSKDWKSEVELYCIIKFLLRRIENDFEYEEYKELIEAIKRGYVSLRYVSIIALHSTSNPKEVWNMIVRYI